MSNTLYRMFGADDALLYVGITNNPVFRFREHRITKDWWTAVARISLTHYESREELAEAEREAVKRERPAWNIVRFKGPAPRRLKRNPPMVRLDAARGSLGFTVAYICDETGLSAGTVADIEAGRRNDLLPAYADALGVNFEDIDTTYEPRQRRDEQVA